MGIAAGIATLVLALGGLICGVSVSAALAQGAPTQPAPPPPPPDPDPIPKQHPPPVQQPPPTQSTQPATPSVQATPAPKKKHRHHKRAKAEQPAFRPVLHEPRDPALVVAGAPKTGLSVEPSRSTGISSSGSSSRLVALFLMTGLGLGGVLLGLAAIPAWVVRPVRASFLIEHWRVEIAATGLSALFAAAVVFLISTSAL